MSVRDRATMLEIQFMMLEEVLIQEARELGSWGRRDIASPAVVCENAQKPFLAAEGDMVPAVKRRTLH